MKAKKVYEFRTSGEIVRMGVDVLIERRIKDWLSRINWNKHRKEITYHYDNKRNTIVLNGEILLTVKDHEFPEIPEVKNIKWEVDTIHAFYSSITKLPDNLTVKNELNLNNNIGLKYLPKNLKVYGNFLSESSELIELPDDIYIDKAISLKLSKNLNNIGNLKFVNGDLDLDYCKSLKYLPDNLTVDGELYLDYTGIIELPENLTVNGSLTLNGTKITKLPDSLKVGRKLELKNTIIDRHDIDYNKFEKVII